MTGGGGTVRVFFLVLNIVSAVLMLSGCITASYKAPDTLVWISPDDATLTTTFHPKPSTTTTVKTTTTSTTSTTMTPCPFDCCTTEFFKRRDCIFGETCINYTCVKTCPHECCMPGEGYQAAECQPPLKCVKNRCLKERCPYECCDGTGRYRLKECNNTWRCIGNQCFPPDADGDGLPDSQEDALDTDAYNKDTDADGWNDYYEAYISRTNPLKANTDADRYDDPADPRPNVTDTAVINFSVKSMQVEFNGKTVSDLQRYYTYHAGSLNRSADIAAIKALIQVSNDGTDYTSYVKYRIGLNHTCESYTSNLMSLNVLNAAYIQGYNVTVSLSNKTNQTVYITHNVTTLYNSTFYNNTVWNVSYGEVGLMKPGFKYTTYLEYTLYVGGLDHGILSRIAYCWLQHFNVTAYDVKYEKYGGV